MKKILIYILLLANLGAGLAFALDTHPEAMVGHDSVAIDLFSSADHPHPDDDLHHGDHCCHAAAHFLGFVSHQNVQCIEGNHDDFIVLSQTPTLLYLSPLLRPPIA